MKHAWARIRDWLRKASGNAALEESQLTLRKVLAAREEYPS